MNIRTMTTPARFSGRSLLVLAAAFLFGLVTCPTSAEASACMADAAGIPALNCTANDFAISSITINKIYGTGCQNVGDTFTFDGLFDVGSGNASRYDVGFYIGEDGKQAYTGMCY